MNADRAVSCPLRLSVTARPLVFGGHAIARRLGKSGLPDWSIAETWECSDVDGSGSVVTDGPLAGRSLRRVVADHPEELMGPGRSGSYFPLLTKFIDATGALPVHLHADDEAARRLEGSPQREDRSLAHPGRGPRRDRPVRGQGRRDGRPTAPLQAAGYPLPLIDSLGPGTHPRNPGGRRLRVGRRDER
ncbi:type I phosphomannose isomerase catalytic subunit [Streptomyces sp. NPDC056160]|uniref:type I phosphomannose isomerase catalytic subunit n=1 Tax=Streptomyces sp. NPDC056160 TaxID=3345731 RepID=UPI0035DDEAA6